MVLPMQRPGRFIQDLTSTFDFTVYTRCSSKPLVTTFDLISEVKSENCVRLLSSCLRSKCCLILCGGVKSASPIAAT